MWIMMRIVALSLFFFSTMSSPSSSSWPAGRLSIPPLAGPPKAAVRVASHYGGWATSAMTLMCAMFSHPVHALLDVVGRWESSTDGTTTCAGLDWRDWEKREINEMGDIQSACQVNITCTRWYIWTYDEQFKKFVDPEKHFRSWWT